MVERKMDGGEIFIEVLNSHGVEYIIGSPGSEWQVMFGPLLTTDDATHTPELRALTTIGSVSRAV